jgi:hypothetical protein
VILATITSTEAWFLVGAMVALCVWAFWAGRKYRQICEEDTERTREREAAQVVPAFDFHLARRPVASTKSPRVVRATEGTSHGRNP